MNGIFSGPTGYANIMSTLSMVAAIAVGIGGWVANDRNIERQHKAEAIIRFDQSADEIYKTGLKFSKALQENKDLSETKDAISQTALKQFAESDSVKRIFSSSIDIKPYQEALQDFASSSQRVQSPIEAKNWIESLDRVIYTRKGLAKQMSREIGL